MSPHRERRPWRIAAAALVLWAPAAGAANTLPADGLTGSPPGVARPGKTLTVAEKKPNIAGPKAVDPGERLSRIEQAMQDRDRRQAPILREWAVQDPDERVRERSIGALTLMGDTDSAKIFLERLTRDPSPDVRRAAAEAIGILKLSYFQGPVAEILAKDGDPLVRAECARALGRIGFPTIGTSLMVPLVQDPSPEVRALCAEALSLLKTPGSVGLLRIAAQEDPSTLVRIYAVRALVAIDSARSGSIFRSVWEGSTDPDLRVEAFRGLLLSGDSSDWEATGLSSLDERIRFLAFRSWLQRAVPSDPGPRIMRRSDPIVRLEAFLHDPIRGIREMAKEALEKIGFRVRPEGFGYAIER